MSIRLNPETLGLAIGQNNDKETVLTYLITQWQIYDDQTLSAEERSIRATARETLSQFDKDRLTTLMLAGLSGNLPTLITVLQK